MVHCSRTVHCTVHSVPSTWDPPQHECSCNRPMSVNGPRIHRILTRRMASSSSSLGTLSVFPLLSTDEFESACRAFLDRVDVLGIPDRLGWSSVRVEQQVVLAL
ncbi:hypothetical protein ASPWEDRAFT_307331 [Aspergillus wentii DTO 134E9]|uniref:Uncharacterized protein n=1 Tax=Aspergillus wentii DTO 134E9 TaxID=1073089 RepID=A0A1L9R3P2_ASPWE|nr:uncharacterized protein ASPWEDRAFT_307331 [Aspergillus wentii DTO 134E9]OJJ29536.1 hypothetical protein ASPWEDRAFT_307331 [Aspergillus wentii DTO 134E9]